MHEYMCMVRMVQFYDRVVALAYITQTDRDVIRKGHCTQCFHREVYSVWFWVLSQLII